MIFTGKNLRMLRTGISYALDELHNEIATCPDVVFYADKIAEIEAERAQLERLLARIDRALLRESRNPPR